VLIIGVFIGITFLTSNNVKSDFGVSVGDVFEYRIKEAYLYVKLGENSFTSIGLRIYDYQIHLGSTLSVNVTAMSSVGVSINFMAGNRQVGGLIYNDFHTIWTYTSIMYVLAIYQTLNIDWEQSTHYMDGINVQFVPPIIPIIESSEEVWEFFENFKDEIMSDISTDTANDQNIQMDYYKKDNGETHISEWLVNFNSIASNSEEYYFSGYSHYQCSYEKEKGVMKGCRYSGMLTGTDATHDDNITVQLVMERDDYQIPDFKLDENHLISGYNIGITTAALTIIATILILGKKRKNKTQ